VVVVAILYLGHGDMTTIKDSVTSMEEEEISSVSIIESLSVSDEGVDMME
jgi:hypothetical protein